MTRSLTLVAALLLAVPATAQTISTGTLAANAAQNQSYDSQSQVGGDVPGLGTGADAQNPLLLFPPADGSTPEVEPVSRSGDALEQPSSGLATVQQVN